MKVIKEPKFKHQTCMQCRAVVEIKPKDIFATFFGICYVIGFLVFIPLLYSMPNGKFLIWYILLAAWGTDTCAYFVGCKFGKHKFSKVSPKKSIEGCVAGVFGAILTALIYTFAINSLMGLSISYLTMGLICAALSVVGQIGDFAASVIKRHFEVKDYSNIFPGHGGMLDRIDSVMFIAPFAYMMFLLIL